MPNAEYARDLLAATMRRPASGADFCIRTSQALGRTWISLLNPLCADGRTVAVIGHLAKSDYYDPHGLGRLALELPRVTFSRWRPRHTRSTTLLTDAVDLADAGKWGKVLGLSVATDTMVADAGPYYLMPFPMFPGGVVRGWEPLFLAERSRPRTTRVLFAGTTDPELYQRHVPDEIRRQHGLALSRSEAVSVLTQGLSKDELVVTDSTTEREPTGEGAGAHQVLLVGANVFPREAWPRVLGSADFFLALPGVFMPLSHNIVESMGAGCIPITSYPGWLSPRLTDGVDCLVYDGADSLLECVRRALAMSTEDIVRLRRGVCDYYDTHLAPSAVPQRLMALPNGGTVYLQAGQSRQTAKIQRGSVAFAG